MSMKKSLWPKAIIGFFAVVFLANGTFIYLALKSSDGLVEENYYEKGLNYDDLLQRQKRLGWQIDLTFAGDLKPGDTNDAKVVISDKTGAPIGDAKVRLVLKRPATNRYDRDFELTPSGCAYHGKLLVPAFGIWDISVRAEKGDDRIEKTFRVRT